MNVSAAIIGLALLLVTGATLFEPHARRRRKPSPRVRPKRDELGPRKEGVLRALRDLDFDFETGKIREEDYRPLRAGLVTEAAEIIKELDQQEAQLDWQLEEAVRHLRHSESRVPICPACGVPLEPEDRFCPACGHAIQASCPKCGKSMGDADAYCSGCGEPVFPLGRG